MSQSVSRDVATPLIVAILCIVGIGMIAATVDTAQSIGGDGDGGIIEQPDEGQQPGQENPDGPGQFEPGNPSDTAERNVLEISACIEFLDSILGTLLVVAGFLGVIGLVYYRFNFSAALLTSWALLPPVALVYFLGTNCATQGPTSGAGGGGGNPIPGGDTAPISPLTNVPSWAIGLLVGLVLVGAVGALYRSMGEEDIVVVEDETIDDGPDLDQFAEAAGRAADRIEEHNADVDNAVYRAWVEMTDLLDVDDPEMYTPGEFAETAVSLGMAEDDVSELTRLFNEVRYGGRDAADREDQALDILRNIESAYSGDERTGDEQTEGQNDE
ncbi:DUF4129 domain-containing protein [Halosimplex salinum]|uniref:DUF4129 domain-containing protein n=1 Tax=Halosimplex salinum TaxID=1710538 RepID=UPI000F476534|nr:DUF4129 domain-containing protein [Halosimplex salinum]